MTMDSLKSKVIAKGKQLSEAVGASASSSAAAAAEASSLAKAAAIAKLAEIQAQAAAAEGKPAPDSSLARAASAAQLDGEEKKLDDNDEVNDPALLNAETTKELTVKLAELMKEHEAAEAEWKEATAKLEAKLEDQAKSDDEQLQKKEEELTQSKATIADLEKLLEAKEAEHAKALEDMQTEKDGDVAKLKETIDGLEKEIATLKETIESKTKEDAEHTATIARLQADIAAMEDRVKAEEAKAASAQEAFDKEKADLEAQVHAGARERRKMHNTIQELRPSLSARRRSRRRRCPLGPAQGRRRVAQAPAQGRGKEGVQLLVRSGVQAGDYPGGGVFRGFRVCPVGSGRVQCLSVLVRSGAYEMHVMQCKMYKCTI